MTVETIAIDEYLNGTDIGYSYAYLDDMSKQNIRFALLKAMCIPGWQVGFESREMPVARGWGSGGLQITLSIVGPDDTIKIIDQGADGSLNAGGMRGIVKQFASCDVTTRTSEATIIQSRHRIPEGELLPSQRLVLQVPHPEPLRRIAHDEDEARRAHVQGDYTVAWVELFDEFLRQGAPTTGADYPVLVEGRVLMSPSPIPRYDIVRLSGLPCPVFLGAGRRAKVMVLPPYTQVEPLMFEDRTLEIEKAGGPCHLCGSASSYRVPAGGGFELQGMDGPDSKYWVCSDTDACESRRLAHE